MRFAYLLAVAPLAMVALPASAQTSRVASTEIQAGDYAEAEAKLLNELRIYPGRPELLLNLAAVYARTGRPEQARMLYAQVLQKDDVLMDINADTTAGSHLIAQTGLRRISTVQVTSR